MKANIVTVQTCSSSRPFHQMVIPSASTPGVIYTVTRPLFGDAREDWSCNCPGWQWRGRCSHLNKVTPCDWEESVGPEKQSTYQKEQHICPRCYASTYDELVIKSDRSTTDNDAI